MITGVATALDHSSCLQSIFFPFIAFQALLSSGLRIKNPSRMNRKEWFLRKIQMYKF